MKKIKVVLISLILFSCALNPSLDYDFESVYYDFIWTSEDFDINLKKRNTGGDFCTIELTLKNKKAKKFSNIYLEFTLYDEKGVNIGNINFFEDINANETLKREEYFIKGCYSINDIKSSKITYN